MPGKINDENFWAIIKQIPPAAIRLKRNIERLSRHPEDMVLNRKVKDLFSSETDIPFDLRQKAVSMLDYHYAWFKKFSDKGSNFHAKRRAYAEKNAEIRLNSEVNYGIETVVSADEYSTLSISNYPHYCYGIGKKVSRIIRELNQKRIRSLRENNDKTLFDPNEVWKVLRKEMIFSPEREQFPEWVKQWRITEDVIDMHWQQYEDDKDLSFSGNMDMHDLARKIYDVIVNQGAVHRLGFENCYMLIFHKNPQGGHGMSFSLLGQDLYITDGNYGIFYQKNFCSRPERFCKWFAYYTHEMGYPQLYDVGSNLRMIERFSKVSCFYERANKPSLAEAPADTQETSFLSSWVNWIFSTPPSQKIADPVLPLESVSNNYLKNNPSTPTPRL